MEKLIIWNELTEESGSDDDEANMETVFMYYYWEDDIFHPSNTRFYHRNSQHYEGRLL